MRTIRLVSRCETCEHAKIENGKAVYCFHWEKDTENTSVCGEWHPQKKILALEKPP